MERGWGGGGDIKRDGEGEGGERREKRGQNWGGGAKKRGTPRLGKGG